MKHSKFWQGQVGLDNIKPKRVGDEWESYDVKSLISELIKDDTVVDIGCGNGRLANTFDPTKYIGMDVNEMAIELAQKENPNYIFRVLHDYTEIPDQEVMLLHSVALHIPDDEIMDLFSRAKSRIVLAETMGNRNSNKTKKENVAFHYGRSATDYVNLLFDWKLKNHITKMDDNSHKTFTYMEFER